MSTEKQTLGGLERVFVSPTCRACFPTIFMSLLHMPHCSLIRNAAQFGIIKVVNVAIFPCRMILRNKQCVKVEKTSFNGSTYHLLKAQLNQFRTDFIEKLKIRMFFSRPSFRNRRLNVVFLEFYRFPFARDY